MFVNRKNEIKLFKEKLKERNGNLLILYGRRRIGKSELLKEIISDKDVYFLADLRERILQIDSLRIQLSEKIPAFADVTLSGWDALFSTLSEIANKKITLVLDEFPYLVKNAPELPSIIQKHIDLKKLKNVNLVLCGSSQSMMTNLFESAKSPLYGRANLIMKLEYIPAYYLKEYLKISSEKAIEEYAVWGGVPRYWEERAKYPSLDKALANLILNPFGLFYEEPIILFLDEMRTSMQSNSILTLVGAGANKISEIAGRLEKPVTHLSKPLQTLLELGYLKKEIPFGENEKKSKKSLYKIRDPFLRFYFTFVVPNRSLIEMKASSVAMKRVKEKWNGFVSAEYENLCREAVPSLFKKRGLFLPAKRYWNRNAEIDIISKDVNSGVYIVGEVKWRDRINLKSVLSELDDKINRVDFLKDKKIIKVIFGKKETERNNVKYFSAADVIQSFI